MKRAKAPFEQPVNSQYGAPMGRRSDPTCQFTGKVHIRRVHFYDGDYDAGGAYWGSGGGPLWCAWDDEGHVSYHRERNREAVEMIFRPLGCTFYNFPGKNRFN